MYISTFGRVINELWCILKDEIADKDRHENHQEFFLTVLDLHSTADNFVLTFPTVIKSR